MKYYLIFAVIAVVTLCMCLRKKKSNEKFTNQTYINPNAETFKLEKPAYKPKKCKEHTRLYGRPNKCFSCEADILRNAGHKYINYAFPSKCFSCERESKNPYMEGPTKCFTCDKNNA